jgi:hypothetical protein
VDAGVQARVGGLPGEAVDRPARRREEAPEDARSGARERRVPARIGRERRCRDVSTAAPASRWVEPPARPLQRPSRIRSR